MLVIGSGFGGAVSALRLVEKGYRVGVLEAGRRYTDATLPKTSWRLRRFLWAPMLGLRGIQRITLLRALVVLSGVGVGGGSLVYANVLYRAPERVFADAQWAHITDWAAELDPHYDTAERMLGVATNPGGTLHDEVLQQVAEDLGVGSTFRLTPSGVFFGEPGARVADPYFGGEGPARRGCVFCAECMTGCRHGAKNRLDLNYLHLAERRGAVIHPDTEAVSLRELPGGGYEVRTRVPGLPWRPSRTYRASQVVLAGGPVGTQRLLHRCKAEGTLPRLSDRLGHLTRTNSQSLLAAERSTPAPGFAHGVANHQLDPPGRRHPRRAGPLRPRQQLHGPAHDPAHRWRAGAGEAVPAGGPPRPARSPGAVLPPPVVGADVDPGGDAGAGQQHHRPAAQRAVGATADLRTWPRRAQPRLDPSRQRRRPPGRGEDRWTAARHLG